MLWRQVDLNHHAVIEASAGTGKTYTIERLVVRLLVEVPHLPISKILMVTFTEKAAGELGERVRAMITEAIRKERIADDYPLSRDQVSSLGQALQAFDTATIATIHSFCQATLREFAFENRQVFTPELVDDKNLIDHALREILRADWRQWYGDRLPHVLERAGIENVNDFLASTIDLVTRIRTDGVEALQPPIVPEKDVLRTAGKLLSALGVTDATLEEYGRLPMRKDDRSKRLGILEHLRDLCAAAQQGNLEYESLREHLFAIWDTRCFQEKNGFECLALARQGNSPHDFRDDSSELLNKLFQGSQPLEEIYRWIQARDLEIVRRTIETACARIDQYKRNHGLISYDDMLVRLDSALSSEENPAAKTLLAALRGKYRYALVDEFQDTDPIQWDIFRRIFVEKTTEHRLFVVGDPKQAIFAFRGADVCSYLEARGVLAQHQPDLNLTTNFRSTPELISVFNELFEGAPWFEPGTDGRGIAYQQVSPPLLNGAFRNPKVGIACDQTERAALTAIDLSTGGELAKGPAVYRLARCIVREIRRLMDNPSALRFIDPETRKVRSLRADDICILIQNHKTARPVEKFLRDARIPYTFYKKRGLYQCDEAAHVACMLGWLASSEDESALRKALLTRFFGLGLEDLHAHQLQADPMIQRHRERWTAYAAKRQWAQLFDSLQFDSGLAFREVQALNGDRRLANFRHIFDDLTVAAVQGNLGVADLYALLEQRRSRVVEVDEEGDLHRLESERDKVRLMTMHMSKGLEFPIVFIADGLSGAQAARKNSAYIVYHDEARHRIYELKPSTGDPAGKEPAAQEAQDELTRIYYVAMTRARYKVYLPSNWATPESSRGRVRFSPIQDLISPRLEQYRAGTDEAPTYTVNEKIGWMALDGTTLGNPAPARVHVEDNAADADDTAAALGQGAVAPVPQLYLLPSKLRGCRRFVDSFTSLAYRDIDLSTRFEDERREGETDENEVDDPEVLVIPAAALAERTEPLPLLPRGKKTGEVVHEILEILTNGLGVGYEGITACPTPSAMLVQNSPVASLIDRMMGKYRLKNQEQTGEAGVVTNSTRLELATCVHRALTTQLPEGFRLGDIAAADRRAEIEFHLREGVEQLGPDAVVEAWRRGLFMGFMDLLFRHQGKYYIVDWKTNTLDDYSAAGLELAMRENNYHLQYRIYTLALLEWLRLFGGMANPAKSFGGVYYLFLRGLNGQNANEGVFHAPWSEGVLQQYQAQVSQVLRPSQTDKGGDQ